MYGILGINACLSFHTLLQIFQQYKQYHACTFLGSINSPVEGIQFVSTLNNSINEWYIDLCKRWNIKFFATALVLIVFLANNFCIHYGVYKGLWDLYGNINVLSTYFLLQIWYLHTSHLLLVIKTTHAAM